MTYYEAIDKIFAGNCVLFTGCGFSADAININKEKVPVSSKLADKIKDACGLKSDNVDLGRISQYFRRHMGEDADSKLVKILKDNFQIYELSQGEQTVGEQPWRIVYTTNYDDAIETAVKNGGKRNVTSLSLDDDPKSAIKKSAKIVHLNGYINTLKPENLDNSFKLTSRSYLSDDFEKSPWRSHFETDLRNADAIFFVGFSMSYDLDLKRVINSCGIKQKTFFIVKKDLDDLTIEELQDFGHVLTIEVDGFAKDIKDHKAIYKPESVPYSITCFREVKFTHANKRPTDRDISDLLTFGNIDNVLISSAMLNKDYQYMVHRKAIKEIVGCISDGSKNIILVSKLGNGKTCTLRALGYELVNQGYKVFTLLGENEHINADIEYICSNFDDAVIIIDDYHSYSGAIKTLVNNRTNQTLITSEREYLYDLLLSEIEEVLIEINEIYIDKLYSEDLKSWDIYLSTYAFWGGKTTESYESRLNYLKNKCADETCSIVVDRIKSVDISRRISQLIGNLEANPKYYKCLVVLVINDILSLNLTSDDISDIIGHAVFNSNTFKKNPAVRELIDFENNDIRFHSPILAQHLTREIIKPKQLGEVLIDMLRKLSMMHEAAYNRRYRNILRNLILYRNLQRLMKSGNDEFTSSALGFYESAKTERFCRENVQFWLQYAIARMATLDYDNAQRYFDTCYALAKKDPGGYDTYKVDNHYSRFLLLKVINRDTAIGEAMEAFRESYNLLLETPDIDKRPEYAVKIVKEYLPFHKKFFDDMAPDHKKEFISCCRKVLKICRAFGLINNRSMQPRLDEVKTGLVRIIKLWEQD